MTVRLPKGPRLDDPTPGVCLGVRGTVAGYGRHIRRLERPCERCREAMNAYNRERRQRWEQKPSAVTRDRRRRKARARAWAALAAAHPAEYRALMRRELSKLMTIEGADHV